MPRKYNLHDKNVITVCFKIKDTSPIVSLLFWLNGDLLNFLGEKWHHCYSNEFTRMSKIEINYVILNAIHWKKKTLFTTSLFTWKPGENNQCQITLGQNFSIVF